MKPLIIAVSVVLLCCLVAVIFYQSTQNEVVTPATSAYIGVAFGGNTVDEAKALIDRTKTYTNLFILQSGPISTNESATTEICNYATQNGQSIIVYFGDLAPQVLAKKGLAWRTTWVENAKTTYGNQFLGVYYYDEPGGIYLDSNKNSWPTLPKTATYDTIATWFEWGFQIDRGTSFLKDHNVSVFCSDYALYWFDYRASYDVVLAEVGWNNSLPQEIALVRGAANFQQKDWGVIITWRYNQTPYLDSGENIYQQMRDSYTAGAKYITIFNYPYDNGTYGIMGDEHFNALQKLWNDVQQGKITQNPPAQAVLLLPKNYGFGYRTAGDTIWGYWTPDEKTPTIWNNTQCLLNKYGYSLDIAYNDPTYTVPDGYGAVYYWNSTLT